jgi:hypothetical protein
MVNLPLSQDAEYQAETRRLSRREAAGAFSAGGTALAFVVAAVFFFVWVQASDEQSVSYNNVKFYQGMPLDR